MKLKSLRKKQIQLRVLVLFKIKFIRLNMKKSRSSTIDVENQTENTESILSLIDVENAEFMSSSISFKKQNRKFKKINFDADIDVDVDRETEIEADQEQ